MDKRTVGVMAIMAILLIIWGCDDDDTPGIVTTPSDRELRVYFASQDLTVDRSQRGPVIADLRYEGPQIVENITVAYHVEFPGANNAVEGEDFNLPKTNMFTINQGRASTEVTLLQQVLPNDRATTDRSLVFRLQDSENVAIGDAAGNGNSIAVTISATANTIANDPNDPDDFIGDKKFTFTGELGIPLKIPYFSNVDEVRDVGNTAVTRAVVVLQGANRNAGSYYSSMLGAAQMESSQLDSILIVSPQFVTEEDIDRFQLDDEHIYWTSSWRLGANSRDEDSNPRPERMSSFTVMDSLMLKISEYPNIKKIVFTGHSAGGQYVNRYSAASPITDELETRGVALSFVVNNPSSYVYMDNKRKVPGTQKTFAVPTSVDICPTYNEYRYGLEGLFTYLEETGGGEDAIRDRLLTRKVTYLVGQEDNDPNANLLDMDCEALLQGADRFERGKNYFNHLLDFYGPSIEENQEFGVVPGVGHSSRGMFQSEKGRSAAFRN